jgi:hypothetical protein
VSLLLKNIICGNNIQLCIVSKICLLYAIQVSQCGDSHGLEIGNRHYFGILHNLDLKNGMEYFGHCKAHGDMGLSCGGGLPGH